MAVQPASRRQVCCIPPFPMQVRISPLVCYAYFSLFDRYTHRNQQVYHDIIIPQTPSSNPNWMKSSSKSGDTNSSSPYPDIELQIMLSQRWAGCNTVLIDVVPYMLIVNQTPLDLKIFDDVAEEDWTLPTNKTFAPPHFQVRARFLLFLIM